MACLRAARAKLTQKLPDCAVVACDSDSKTNHFWTIERSTRAKLVRKMTSCAALSCGADSAPAHVVVATPDFALFGRVSDFEAEFRSILE